MHDRVVAAFYQCLVISVVQCPQALGQAEAGYSYYVGSFPGFPHFFDLGFSFSIIHRSGRVAAVPLPCVTLNINRRTETGESWNKVTYYVHTQAHRNHVC